MVDPLTGAFLGALAPAVLKELRDQAHRLRMNRGWKGPFVVWYDERFTGDVRALADERGRSARFTHLLVQNASGVAVPKSRGVLRNVRRRTDDGRYVPVTEYRRRLPLRWANLGSMDPIEIAPGDIERLDLCYAVEGDEEFRFAVPRGPHGVQTDYGPGVYKVTIRVEAPGAAFTEEDFLIIYRGTWKDVQVIAPDVQGILEERVSANPDFPREMSLAIRPSIETTTSPTIVASHGQLESESTNLTRSDDEDADR